MAGRYREAKLGGAPCGENIMSAKLSFDTLNIEKPNLHQQGFASLILPVTRNEQFGINGSYPYMMWNGEYYFSKISIVEELVVYRLQRKDFSGIKDILWIKHFFDGLHDFDLFF